MHTKTKKAKYPIRNKPIHSRAIDGAVENKYDQRLKQSGYWQDYISAEKQ